VDLKVLEVDPIHHRILLAITDFPAEPAPQAAAPEPAASESSPPEAPSTPAE
jgi:hypothetical protein